MFCEICAGIVTLLVLPLAALVAIFIIRKRRRANRKGFLHVEEWERDTVYLVQFPCSPFVRTISPFSLKMETWLRMNKIRYQNVYTLKFGSKGQIPYVELNGEEIPDSNVIIDRLSSHFKLENKFNPLAHAVTVMVENHTAQIGFYWRYGFNMNEFCDKLVEGRFSPKALKFWRFFQPYGMRFKGSMIGIGRHNQEEVAKFSFKDILAISELLGDKDFMEGDDISTLDCTLFGHLAQFLYIPMDFPQKAYIRESCQNLISYVDRIRGRLWPDWKEMCEARCMEGKMGRE